MLQSLRKAFLEASKSSNPDAINEGVLPQNPILMQVKPEVQQDNPSMPGQEGNMSKPTSDVGEPDTPQTCKKPHIVNAKPDQQFPKMNPEGHVCHVCGVNVAERYALSLDKNVRWGWFCLSCKPYAEPERNQNLPAL